MDTKTQVKVVSPNYRNQSHIKKGEGNKKLQNKTRSDFIYMCLVYQLRFITLSDLKNRILHLADDIESDIRPNPFTMSNIYRL